MAESQIPEMNCLMSLVEKIFRKDVKTSTDSYSVTQEIESETRECLRLSVCRRKR